MILRMESLLKINFKSVLRLNQMHYQQLIDKMNARTVKKDGEVQKTGDQQTLDKINKELTSNVKRMKQLIRFNNIMSGFFEVKKGAEKNNLVPLNIELATLKDDDRLKRV